MQSSPHRRLSAAAAAALLPLVCACGQAGDLPAIGGERSAVVYGEVSGAEDDAVVSLTTPSSTCTGTLIAPNVVLTALHCVAESKPYGMFSCRPDGSLVSNSTDGQIGALLDPATIEVRTGPTYSPEPAAYGQRLFGTGSMQSCQNDIAVLVLDRTLDEPLAPLRFDRLTVRGERMRVVGYGHTEETGSSGRHVRGSVLVVDVGTDGTSPGSSTAAPKTIVLGEGPCLGDSGGPALSETSGAIAGVYSILAAPSCTAVGVRNVYTQVAPFETLIRDALDFAGHEPLVEGEDGAGGAPGAGGESSGGQATGEGGDGGETTAGTGGASAQGGGGTGGSSATGGTEASAGTGALGTGSGSRRDPSCACRIGTGGRDAMGLPACMGFAAALGLLLLRRRRARIACALE